MIFTVLSADGKVENEGEQMSFCTQISLSGTLCGDYKWKSSSEEQPLLDGLYIGMFKEYDTLHFSEIKYENGYWKWFSEWEKPCTPIGWVGVPSCILYTGKDNNEWGEDNTNGLIIARPWKNAKTEKPIKTDIYFVVTKYVDEEDYMVSPCTYDATIKMFGCELDDPKEEVFAYIEMPTNYRDIF